MAILVHNPESSTSGISQTLDPLPFPLFCKRPKLALEHMPGLQPQNLEGLGGTAKRIQYDHSTQRTHIGHRFLIALECGERSQGATLMHSAPALRLEPYERSSHFMTKKTLSLLIDSSKAEIVTDINTAIDLLKSDTSKVKKEYSYYIKKDTSKNINVYNRIQDFHHFYTEFPTYSASTALDSLGYEKTFWNKMYYQQTINSNKNFEKYKSEGKKAFIKTLTSYISISLFIFLPFFTLFLCLIYIRKKYTYIENLVFVFHVQTVFFILLSVFYLLNLMVETDGFLVVFTLLFAFYLYKALRYFYHQNRLKTIIKFILLNGFYMFLASIGFLIIAVLSFIVG